MPPCDVCGAEGAFKCSRCGQAYYCSADHQRQAWKTHKHVCRELLAATLAAPGQRWSSATPSPASVSTAQVGVASPASGAAYTAQPLVSTPAVSSHAGSPLMRDALTTQAVSTPPRDLGRGAKAKVGMDDGMCLYINLDRRPDRRTTVESIVAQHPWLAANVERVQAVDGRDLSWPRLVGDRLVAPEAELEALRAARAGRATAGTTRGGRSNHLTLGACGCALSHRKAWRALVDSGLEWALVLEDRVTAACQSFDAELAAVLRELPADWYMCYLGFHTGALLPEGKHFAGPLTELRGADGWLPGLWAYLISKAGAQLMLRSSVPLLAQADSVVGCLAASSNRGFTVLPGQFLFASPPTEESRDTDVQTFPESMT
mmetsp:Transcript_1965/g.5721  ORF Transcript_1965/g.5721 Transcript_1965/m.5721 type:complete len:374 (+) Transcript_1965:75-1196(+)